MVGWRWVACAAALVVIVSAPASLAAPAAAKAEFAQIVARYIAWRGGAPFRKGWRSVHETIDLKLFGLTGSAEGWQTPDHWRTEVEAPGVRQTTVTTAHGSWTTSIDGQIESAPDAYRYAKRDPAGAAAVLGKDGATARLMAPQTLNGRIWQVVRVSYGDADTYDDLIDGETGELAATLSVVKGQPSSDYFSDWRMIDGVRAPFVTRTVTASGDEQTQTIVSYQANVRIDPALFTRPTSDHRLTYAPGQTSTGWMPFTGWEIGRIYLPVKVNGHETRAMFDSAASGSAIDSTLAASIGLKPVGVAPLGGENGVGHGGIVADVDISLGGATLKGVTLAAFDLKATGADFPMLVGAEVFHEAVVDIDFPNHRLALRDPAHFRPPPGAIAVATTQESGWQLLPISIEGGSPGLYIVDTGYPPPLRIAPRVTAAQKLLAGKPFVGTATNAIGGVAGGKYASLKRVSVGGVTFANVPAIFSDAWPAATYTDRVSGLVGVMLLSRFRVIVDWSRDRTYLIRGPEAQTAPFARDRLGVGWTRDGDGMRVTAVAPGSPVERAGLKIGEIIDTINGKPATAAGDVGALPPGTKVELTVRDAQKPASASIVTVTLADYY